jgi:hypothetical protein
MCIRHIGAGCYVMHGVPRSLAPYCNAAADATPLHAASTKSSIVHHYGTCTKAKKKPNPRNGTHTRNMSSPRASADVGRSNAAAGEGGRESKHTQLYTIMNSWDLNDPGFGDTYL